MRTALALLGTGFLLVMGLAAAPAVVAGDPCYHGFDIPARTEGAETQIKVAPCAFAPTVTHVAVGSRVTFFNGPGFTHLITGANGEWGSKDVEIQPGQEISYTFTQAGIYPYACALHRGMSGTIVVGNTTSIAPAAPAAPASPSQADASESPAPAGVGLGLVVVVGAAGVVLGGLAAFGIVRSRRDRAVA